MARHANPRRARARTGRPPRCGRARRAARRTVFPTAGTRARRSAARAGRAAPTRDRSPRAAARPRGPTPPRRPRRTTRRRAATRTPRARDSSARTRSRTTARPRGRRPGARGRQTGAGAARLRRRRRRGRTRRTRRARRRTGSSPAARRPRARARSDPRARRRRTRSSTARRHRSRRDGPRRPHPTAPGKPTETDAVSWPPMHPGVVETRTLDGLTVTLRRWDPQRNGEIAHAAPPVLLVYGLGANTVSWLPVGQALADRRNGPVLALDLAGFGYTRSVGTTATVQRNAALVIAALEAYGPGVVVGNSMGGAIAVKVSAQRPDLVQRLILVNPALRPVFGSPQWRQAWLLSPMMFPRVGARVIGGRARQLGAEGMVDGTLQLVLSDPAMLERGIRDEFVTIATARGAYPEAARAYADAASSMFWYLVRNLDRDLANLLRTHPALIVFGDRDRLVHISSARALSARHPDLDVAIMEGIGHAPQLDAPQRFVDVVDEWLRGRSLDQAEGVHHVPLRHELFGGDADAVLREVVVLECLDHGPRVSGAVHGEPE